MTDLAENVAIALGVIAVAIAIWDDVCDRVYYHFGPVDVSFVSFEIPDPAVVRPVRLRMTGRVRNRLSWPVSANINFVLTTKRLREQQPRVTVRDELLEETPPRFFLPPRQPRKYQVWVEWPFGEEATLTPTASTFTRKIRSKYGTTKRISWPDGCPVLTEVARPDFEAHEPAPVE